MANLKKKKSPIFNIHILYTDEEANMTGLPLWVPEMVEDDEPFTVLMLSFGLLFFTLVVPTVLLLVFGGYKRSRRRRNLDKQQAEDFSHLDHVFDPDGRYRTHKFEGMLNEDAADDVEIPSKSEIDESTTRNVLPEKKNEGANLTPKKRDVGTQTNFVFVYSNERTAPVKNRFDKNPVLVTQQSEEEMENRKLPGTDLKQDLLSDKVNLSFPEKAGEERYQNGFGQGNGKNKQGKIRIVRRLWPKRSAMPQKQKAKRMEDKAEKNHEEIVVSRGLREDHSGANESKPAASSKPKEDSSDEHYSL